MDVKAALAALERYGADLDEAMERFMDDEELYVDCLRLFLQDRNFAELGDALEAADIRRAFEAAHTLKGVAGNLGVAPLYATICDIVEQLRADKRERLLQTYEQLREQRGQLEALLDQ